MKRIAQHKISRRIDAWSTFIKVLSILDIIGGIIIFVVDGIDGEEFWYFGPIIILLGLLTMAGAKIVEGFSVIVRNAEKQLVDSGDDMYLDYIQAESYNKKSEQE